MAARPAAKALAGGGRDDSGAGRDDAADSDDPRARHRDAELSGALDGFLAERRRPLLGMLERAVERGELPPDADLELGVDLILGPFVVRLFFTAGPVDPDLVAPIVDAVIRGLGGVAPPKP